MEGWRLCAEALKMGLEPKVIFYSRSRLLKLMGPLLDKDPINLASYLNLFPLVKTPYKKLQIWSSLTTPPGITGKENFIIHIFIISFDFDFSCFFHF